MENMDKGLTVPKWVLIVQPKIPQMPQNLSAQAQKFEIFNEKRLHWASLVRVLEKAIKYDKISKFYLKLFSSVILFLWSSIEYRRALEYKVSFLPFQTCLKLVN